MTVKISPSAAVGTVAAPASKSMAHRLLICAGLSEGKSIINNIAYSEDISATLDCLEVMGAKIRRDNDSAVIEGALPKECDKGLFPCRESGSTLRFFVPVALLSDKAHSFSGYGKLMERPMSIYEKICKEKKLLFTRDEGMIQVQGPLTGGIFTLKGNISSQFISGLLFALPLCDADSEIHLIPPVESRSYIDMTISAMRAFGVKVEWKNDLTLYINGGQRYAPTDLTVEGDWSNAAFLDAFNLLGGEVTVTGLDSDSLQGDKVYREYYTLLKGGTPTLDIGNCPDLAPVLMTLAAQLKGAKFTNTARLKIKESDRGAVMAQELAKFGARIHLSENEITVEKSALHAPTEKLCGHNDHRVVMSLSVLASAYGGEIEGAEAVRKSYPDFFEKIKTLSVEVQKYDD